MVLRWRLGRCEFICAAEKRPADVDREEPEAILNSSAMRLMWPYQVSARRFDAFVDVSGGQIGFEPRADGANGYAVGGCGCAALRELLKMVGVDMSKDAAYLVVACDLGNVKFKVAVRPKQ